MQIYAVEHFMKNLVQLVIYSIYCAICRQLRKNKMITNLKHFINVYLIVNAYM